MNITKEQVETNLESLVHNRIMISQYITKLEERVKVLEDELIRALDVIDDYLSYEHNGDPWCEDARAMGEMDINTYSANGGLEKAKAALAGGKDGV